MHRRHKYDIIIILSLIGFAVSIYLATAHYLGFAVPCNLTHGCEAVLSSKYSYLLGIPLSAWGVVFYTGAIVACLLANHYSIFKKLLTLYLSLGTIASAVFIVEQFFIIKQVCQYCLVTDVLAIILLLVDLNIEHKPFNKIEQN